MKKAIYIFGIISCLVVATGISFKVQHWPGAGILLTCGISFLVLVFLPMALINNYRNEESKPGKWFYIITYITCFILYGSILFKIQHWPGAGNILLLAIPFPFVVFLPILLYHSRKEEYFSINQSVIVILLLAYVSVITAMLALNVSKNLLDDSKSIQKEIKQTNDQYIRQIANISHKIEKQNNVLLNEKKKSISHEGQELFSLIQDAKWEITKNANGSEGNTKENINLNMIRGSDKYDPVWIAIYGDSQYGVKLLTAFDKYREFALGLIPEENKEFRDLVTKCFSTKPIKYEGEDIRWINYYFRKVNTTWALSNLTQFQENVLLVETELLNYLYFAELTNK